MLGRVETEAGDIAETADTAIAITTTSRLRAILDDPKSAPLTERGDRVHVGGLTIQMHGDDRLAARGYGVLDARRVDRVISRIDIDQHRRCAGRKNGRHGSHRLSLIHI